VLAVGGTATLGGTLAPSLINGFTPAGGATFQILTAAPRSGTFGSVSGPFTAQYNANDVTLVAPVPQSSRGTLAPARTRAGSIRSTGIATAASPARATRRF
jgi:hypothetical protein